VASLEVVAVDVAANGGPGILDVVPFHQVGFFILEGSEPPLNPDVVSQAALAIHALAYMVLLERFFVLLAGELAPCDPSSESLACPRGTLSCRPRYRL
jgi:hypothetical protein